MTHLDLIKFGNNITKYLITIPVRLRNNNKSPLIFKDIENIDNVLIFADKDQENDSRFDSVRSKCIFTEYEIKGIASKRKFIVDYCKNNHEAIWMIDDDRNKWYTRDLENKDKILTITEALSSAEDNLDISNDAYMHLSNFGIGLKLFGKNRQYTWKDKRFSVSKKKCLCQVYLLNLDIMKRNDINFEINCDGCEDLEITLQFINKGLKGKTTDYIEGKLNNQEISSIWLDYATVLNKLKNNFRFMYNKYGEGSVYWNKDFEEQFDIKNEFTGKACTNSISINRVSSGNYITRPEWL